MQQLIHSLARLLTSYRPALARMSDNEALCWGVLLGLTAVAMYVVVDLT